jgi:AraC-like DNA-binding protein
VVAAAWERVSFDTMRHILEQAVGRRDIADEVVHRFASAFTAPRPGGVHFATQRRELEHCSLMTMTLSALRMNGGLVGASEVVRVGFVLSGSITMTPQDGEPILLSPGAAWSVSDWSPFIAESADGTRCLTITIPTQRLRDRGVRVGGTRVRLEGVRSLKGPLRGFALAIADASWNPTPVGRAVAERLLEDLLVGMFLESTGYAIDVEDLRADLRARAITHIADRHREPGLNPRAVADHLAVSLRHLQRAFEDSGGSIASAITHRRAETATLLLGSPGASELTIEEVARRSGFSSAFELRAAFRSEHGMLPSEFRGQHA